MTTCSDLVDEIRQHLHQPSPQNWLTIRPLHKSIALRHQSHRQQLATIRRQLDQRLLTLRQLQYQATLYRQRIAYCRLTPTVYQTVLQVITHENDIAGRLDEMLETKRQRKNHLGTLQKTIQGQLKRLQEHRDRLASWRKGWQQGILTLEQELKSQLLEKPLKRQVESMPWSVPGIEQISMKLMTWYRYLVQLAEQQSSIQVRYEGKVIVQYSIEQVSIAEFSFSVNEDSIWIEYSAASFPEQWLPGIAEERYTQDDIYHVRYDWANALPWQSIDGTIVATWPVHSRNALMPALPPAVLQWADQWWQTQLQPCLESLHSLLQALQIFQQQSATLQVLPQGWHLQWTDQAEKDIAGTFTLLDNVIQVSNVQCRIEEGHVLDEETSPKLVNTLQLYRDGAMPWTEWLSGMKQCLTEEPRTPMEATPSMDTTE